MTSAIDVYVVVEWPNGARQIKCLNAVTFKWGCQGVVLSFIGGNSDSYLELTVPPPPRRLFFNLSERSGEHRFFATRDEGEAAKVLEKGFPAINPSTDL